MMATPSRSHSQASLERSGDQPAGRPDRFALTRPSTYVLGFAIISAATLIHLALDAGDTSFAVEWSILTFVALVTFSFLISVAIRAIRAAVASISDYARHAASTRADTQLLELARRDPRKADEIRAAQARADAVRRNVRLSARSR